MSPNRVLVQEGIYDAYVARLTDKVQDIQVGHGLQPGVHQVRAAIASRHSSCLCGSW